MFGLIWSVSFCIVNYSGFGFSLTRAFHDPVRVFGFNRGGGGDIERQCSATNSGSGRLCRLRKLHGHRYRDRGDDGAGPQAPHREIWCLLVPHGSAGLSAGAVAKQVSMAPSTISFHLQQMTKIGALTLRQNGRYSIYSVRTEVISDLCKISHGPGRRSRNTRE